MVPEQGWFWRKDGTVYGPVPEPVLRTRILDGEITRGMLVRLDQGAWVSVQEVEDWDLLLGSAENLRTRQSEAQVRRGFGVAGLVAALCVSAWSVASQVPSANAPRSVASVEAAAANAAEGESEEENVGGLGRERIAEGFREAGPQLQGCAERFQINGGQIPEKMVLTYSIQNSGAVTDVMIHPTEISRSPMGRCVVGVMRRLDYPSFAGKVRPVSFPLVFD